MLSKSERIAFLLTYKKLYAHQQEGQEYKESFVDKLSKMHMEVTKYIHGTPQFLPWHRYVVYMTERELIKYNPSIVMPYWNWAFDSQAPELAPIWGPGPDAFGTNGDPQHNNCVKDGALATVELGVPTEQEEQESGNTMPAFRSMMSMNAPVPKKVWKCLKREWSQGDKIGALTSTDAIHALIAKSKTYDFFRRQLEYVPHAQVHVAISGDMGRTWSPNDPLFFLHHTFVDKLWNDWQKTAQNGMTSYEGEAVIDGQRIPAKVTDELAGFKGVTVQQVMDIGSMCYEYAELVMPGGDMTPPSPIPGSRGNKDAFDNGNWESNGGTLNEGSKDFGKFVVKVEQRTDAAPVVLHSHDRSDMMHIRHSPAVPALWFKANGIPEPEARQMEAEHRALVDNINRIEGYVSPCAYWNRVDLISSLSAKGTPLLCGVGGTNVQIHCTQSNTPSISTAELIKQAIRDAVKQKVQLRPAEFKQALQALIGEPVMQASCASNPFAKRHADDVGFGTR